jgi:hypothetical protein
MTKRVQPPPVKTAPAPSAVLLTHSLQWQRQQLTALQQPLLALNWYVPLVCVTVIWITAMPVTVGSYCCST